LPKICYIAKAFPSQKLQMIDFCNSIMEDYARMGYDLTLRQLYYQLVSRSVIPNVPKSYDMLSDLIADARIGGLVDWNHIVDRTRNMVENTHWEKPREIVEKTVANFAIDKWLDQDHYVEVWVEKDALRGIVASACSPLDVPHFSCRGYTSISEVWAAAMRLKKKIDLGKEVHIIHLGDHDPSGMDMSRDIKTRLTLFCGAPKFYASL
jgi:hypothetical protein